MQRRGGATEEAADPFVEHGRCYSAEPLGGPVVQPGSLLAAKRVPSLLSNPRVVLTGSASAPPTSCKPLRAAHSSVSPARHRRPRTAARRRHRRGGQPHCPVRAAGRSSRPGVEAHRGVTVTRAATPGHRPAQGSVAGDRPPAGCEDIAGLQTIGGALRAAVRRPRSAMLRQPCAHAAHLTGLLRASFAWNGAAVPCGRGRV